jgi:hypothetical protein
MSAQEPGARSPVTRIAITPPSPLVGTCDTLRIKATALDSAGRAVPGATIRLQVAGGAFLGGSCTDPGGPRVAAEAGDANPPTTGGRGGGGRGARGAAPSGPGTVAPDGEGIVIGAANPSMMRLTVSATVEGSAPFVTTIPVSVVASAATRIDIDPTPARLVTGQSITLRAQTFSSRNDPRLNDRLTWTSSAPAVARIDADGNLLALAAGRAVIAGASGALKKAFTVEVIPANLRSFSISPAKTSLRTGDVMRFTVSATDAAGRAVTGLTPTWSFAPGEGIIDADGGFVAYKPGQYSIMAGVGPRSAVATVTVSARDVRRAGTIVGAIPIGHAWTAEVAVHPMAPVAYFSLLDKGIAYVVDMRDPAKPTIVDSMVVNARVVNDINISEDGKVIVLGRQGADNRRSGITVFTTDDPLHPKLAADLSDGIAGGVHSATINTQSRYGRFVYCTYNGRMIVIDINDPANPKIVSAYAHPGLPHDYYVEDGIAYASWIGEGLLMIDVGNGVKGGSPSNPQLISHYKYDIAGELNAASRELGASVIGGTHAAWRKGKYVFFSDEIFNDAFTGRDEQAANRASGQPGGLTLPERFWSSLRVIDVSDITRPRLVAWYRPEFGGIHNFAIAGDTLYLGTFNAGFRTFDIAGELRGDLREQGREITHVNTVDWKGKKPNAAMTWGAIVKDGLAYVPDMHNGLFIIRMQPRTPVVP